MGLASVVGQDRDQRLTPAADARLALGVGVACVVAFAVFVLPPYYATDLRLHLVTLLLAAALFVGLASAWGSGVVSWWAD